MIVMMRSHFKLTILTINEKFVFVLEWICKITSPLVIVSMGTL